MHRPEGYQACRERFIDIIVDAFGFNPSVQDIIKQDHKKEQRLKRLASYSFHFGERRKANYLSSDSNGIVISYVEDYRRTLADYWADVKLILQVSGLGKALYLLRKEAYRKRVRPKAPFYYVWFIGVDSEHRGGECSRELKKWVFDEANRLQLPILIETTIPKNKRAYEFFGFKVYHVHRFHKNTPPTFFMRKEVEK